eukprot:scaffold1947_cov207-Prasinococcus_capsulatus_cf.AAC.36
MTELHTIIALCLLSKLGLQPRNARRALARIDQPTQRHRVLGHGAHQVLTRDGGRKARPPLSDLAIVPVCRSVNRTGGEAGERTPNTA